MLMKKNRDDRWKELAKVSIIDVAKIAAHLPPETPAVDAVRRAYELLEWAAAGREGFDEMEYFLPEAESGLYAEVKYHLDRKKEDELRSKSLMRVPINPKRSFEGFRPHPFDAVLANLMKPVKKVDRLPRFKWWLMASAPKIMTPDNAVRRIEEWRKDGVPDSVYQLALRSFDDWWEKREKERLSNQGKKPKKGKQGRVKTEDDGRVGAKPPIEEFRKIIEGN
jgi:hypothetical protein